MPLAKFVFHAEIFRYSLTQEIGLKDPVIGSKRKMIASFIGTMINYLGSRN